MAHVVSNRNMVPEKEAAEYIGMSVYFLQKARSEGHRNGRTKAPPFIKIGRAVRYSIDDLDRFIEQNRCQM